MTGSGRRPRHLRSGTSPTTLEANRKDNLTAVMFIRTSELMGDGNEDPTNMEKAK